MKRVSNRSVALLLFAVIVLAGLCIYVFKVSVNGKAWVSFPSNQTVYANGVLQLGTLVDRNGIVLSQMFDGTRTFAEDASLRKATLHAVGDLQGNIGTSALSAFASKLIGYNPLTGAYSRTGQGKTVTLTIDADLNLAAYKALNGKKGTVGVMNYETGELLCMVSSPTFDPADVPDLQTDESKYEGVFINRFLSSTYTPGSVFKLVTLAAAIENIDDLYDRVFECTGGIQVGEDYVKCTEKHGALSIEDALAVSCNSAFAELALELGAETLSRYADKLGLTRSITIDGITTAAGSFEKAESGTANLGWSGIGQYNDTISPSSMLRYVGAIANGGTAVNMSLIRDAGLARIIPAASERVLSKETAENIATIMSYAVYKTYGQDNYPGLELHAKSGTAEIGGDLTPHAWFVGYITNKDFPLAFVVVVENGGSGSQAAGPIANKVLQAAIKK